MAKISVRLKIGFLDAAGRTLDWVANELPLVACGTQRGDTLWSGADLANPMIAGDRLRQYISAKSFSIVRVSDGNSLLFNGAFTSRAYVFPILVVAVKQADKTISNLALSATASLIRHFEYRTIGGAMRERMSFSFSPHGARIDYSTDYSVLQRENEKLAGDALAQAGAAVAAMPRLINF